VSPSVRRFNASSRAGNDALLRDLELRAEQTRQMKPFKPWRLAMAFGAIFLAGATVGGLVIH
jgi:hypothetical protein